MKQIVKEQILKVRDTGKTNMLDCRMVMHTACHEGFYELAAYLMDSKNLCEYSTFILTGKTVIKD